MTDTKIPQTPSSDGIAESEEWMYASVNTSPRATDETHSQVKLEEGLTSETGEPTASPSGPLDGPDPGPSSETEAASPTDDLEKTEESILASAHQSAVTALEAKLDAISTELSQSIAERARAVHEFQEQAKQLSSLEASLRRAHRETRKLESVAAERTREIDRLTANASKLRKKSRTLQETLAALEEQLQTEQREQRRMKRKLKQLETHCARYKRVDVALNWLAGGLGTNALQFPKLLATIGTGPFPSLEFDGHLQSRQFELVWPGNGAGNEDVEVVVVGRSDWDEERLEQQLAAREGKTLRVYSQEMFLISIATNRDLLEELDLAELKAIAEDHPALKFLSESELEWPHKIVPALPSEFRFFDTDGRADASPLHMMGYSVGKTHGRPAPERHRLLSRAFEKDIPWVESEQYMSDWGRPRTRRRLWRIANHLGWLARSWKQLPSHSIAVSDWVSDLNHLKRAHYRPWMGFKWPEVRVPGE